MNYVRTGATNLLAPQLCLTVMALGAFPIACGAHDQSVHQAIAQSGALSSEGFSRFLSDIHITADAALLFQPSQFPVAAPGSPIFWLTNGSFFEDEPIPRWGDHFYTVTPDRVAGAAPGLTDWQESLFLPANIANSFRWATEAGLAGPYLFPFGGISGNTDKWGDARNYEYTALTSPGSLERDANMAHMFYAIGHVLHLNQDLSQPEHVRNDAHPFRRCIENFGSRTFLKEPNAFPLVSRGWSYWQSQGFSKLLDFWDRGHYNGNAAALDADVSGSDKLGLAEFSNGNFLGQDATYGEFCRGTLHYFPLPSLANTTQPRLKAGHLSDTVIDRVTLENHQQGDSVYVEKLAAGVCGPIQSGWAERAQRLLWKKRGKVPDWRFASA